MELGSKIKQARLTAGLSQRQLCGDTITRNMLSQIENGTARPSMDTLKFLAAQLGKSVSYFLEENTVESPNPQVMERAREAYAQRKFNLVLEILHSYRSPDPLFDHEMRYLTALSSLAQGEALLDTNAAAAAQLLEQVHRGSIYYRPDMEQKRRLLLRQCYQQLEAQAQQQEDYKQAYFYACKLRDLG